MNRVALWKALIFAPLIPFLLAASCNMDKITGIDATASPSSLSSGGISSLNATVTGAGTFNANVNWSIVSGGGSLSSNTGGTVTYTAPTVSVQTSVQVRASAAGDSSFTKTLTLTVSPLAATDKPVISSFTATPSTLPSGGGNTLLVWNVAGATSLSVNQSVGDVTGLTSKSVAVTATTTFTLTATNANGSNTKTIDVTVQAPPPPGLSINAFTATPSNLNAAGDVTLEWDVTGATTLELDGVGVTPLVKGSKKVNVTKNTSFVLKASNANGSTSKSVDVTLSTVNPQVGIWDQSNWDAANWQ